MTFIDLLSEYHIMPQFPPNVLRWLETAPTSVEECDLKNRMDLTDKLIITIDGDDAKDFDDAVSLDILENGNYMLGVHIADVTHYVTENSSVDRAAFCRGTSVYLIDTVIPMLPFELSNDLCSLKTDEIRLTVSVFMEISPKGKLEDYRICESFIKSRERMTYHNVTKILEGDERLCQRYSHLIAMLNNMDKLAKLLNKKRVLNGSIEFETHESKITLDSKGVPVMVEKYPITVSNGIIEEFMLAANVTVARYFAAKGLPCVYRVHEEPDLDRIERLAKVLPQLGVEFSFKPDMQPKDFQKILDSVTSFDTCSIVNYLVLRSMSRARYSEKNLGHFGLSFSDYCHFTSPIRRYPDLAVHRILKESLKGDLSEKRLQQFKEFVISAAVNSSMTETFAADAELRWKDIKKAEYMSMHIGEKFVASITHVTASGFFAELDNTVEGFVAARTMDDDLYMMNKNGLSLEGMRTKRRFSVGDRVEIKVISADAAEGKIDFEVVGTRTPKFQMRNTKRGKVSGKKALNRNEKRVLKEFKEQNRQQRREKSDIRGKLDSEKYIFENAVVYGLYDILRNAKRLKKDEERFVGVTLKDLAATISQPVYRKFAYETHEISTKNIVVSAMMNVKNTLAVLCDSFGVELGEDEIQLSVEYVSAALRHLEFCMKNPDVNFSKREREYDNIMKKLNERRG